MKKQINPSIKAHLLPTLFILLSLLAIAVIPFAQAQRNATKQSAAKSKVDPSGAVAANLSGVTQLPHTPAAPWTIAAPVAVDHYGGFMDSDGTFAWEGGGYSFSAGGTIAQFGRFDPVANTWTPLAAVPDLNNAEASAVYAPNVNKLFVFGGDNPASGTVVATTRIYDIPSNNWTTGANMPDVRAFMASGYYNGKIYLVGGYSTGNITPAFLQTWEYDPIANTFVTKTPIPAATGFGGAGSGVINGHLYVAGGRDANNTIINTTWDYNIATDTWTQQANMAAADNVPGSAVIAGQLWVFGGGNPFAGPGTSPRSIGKGVLAPDTTNTLQIYDPGTNTWTSGPSLNQQRSFPAGTHVGNTAVAVGGYTGASTTTSVEVNVGGGTPTPTPTATPTPPPCGPKIFNIAGFGLGIQTTTTRIYDITTNTWSTGAPIPEPNGLSDHATGYWNGKIYVAGGYNGSGATNVARSYDIASNTWTTIAPLPVALYLPGFGVINGKFYVASGNNGSTEVNTLYIYDTGTNTWTTGPVVPTPVTGPGSAVYQGKLYLFGGAAPFPSTTTITQIYDPVANSWSSGPSMNMARLWFYGGAVDATSIVAPGGDNSPGIPINDNEQLTASWAVRAPLPYNARGPFAVSDGTYVYIGGGYDGSSVHTDTLRYDPVANTYTPLAPSGDAHFLSQAVFVNTSCCTPSFRVLIAYSDIGGPPTTLQSQILAEPGVTAVDLFDASSATPTLAQLQPYNIVVAFSNNPYSNAVAMGDVLADYADTGGIVVGLNFDWYGPPFGLDGRWMTGGYTPFNSPAATNFSTSCLGTYDMTHPLMQGISPGSLCAFFRHTLTLSPGAVSVAMYQDAQQLCAYKTNNGHTGVGINAYLGENPMNFSGPFGRVIVNAGRWLGGSCTPTVTGAVSRMTHGAAGTFDVALPLTGTDGVECRTQGGTHDFTMVVTFSGNVTVTGSPQAQVTSGTGCVGSAGVCTGNVTVSGNVVTVPLTTIGDQQNINVRINGVNGAADAPATDFNIPMGVLAGDTNANRTVNAADVSQTKGQSGQTVTAANFRNDVNANGTINAGDINIVKAASGHSIP